MGPIGPALPLNGFIVLDFSQFLAGPVAALRLADLGARVIKIERPISGELGRTLAFAGLTQDGDTLSFQAMNRNKQSVAADLKDPEDLAFVKQLVRRADVIIENFRPGVMERLGMDYHSVRTINPSIVYGSVTGYGASGPWKDRAGQDLLAQAVSGLPWLNGTAEDPPVPVGLSVADHLASCQLALGVTSLLLRRGRRGVGVLVETSLLEAVLDLEIEHLTAFFSKPAMTTTRAGKYSVNAFLGAPYGVYPTADGYLAIAMNSVPKLGKLIGLSELEQYTDPDVWMERKDVIRAQLADHLREKSTRSWLEVLEPSDIWCAEVLTLEALAETEAFWAINMLQETERPAAFDRDRTASIMTTRIPLRIDGHVLTSPVGAPRVGEHTALLRAELRDNGVRMVGTE